MQKRKEKKKREKKETGNGDAHTLRKGIPGPKPHFLPSKVTETSLLYLRSRWKPSEAICCGSPTPGPFQLYNFRRKKVESDYIISLQNPTIC